jgi:hypothetical protein
VAPKVVGSIPVDLTSPNFRQLDALSSVRSQQGAETQSGLFCTIETMRAPRWLACLMLGSGPQHASFLYTLVSSIRSSPGPTRLRPGGMDTQNWKAMFADRESDDENKWIITSAFSDYDEPRDRLYALEAPVRTVSLPPGSGHRKPGLTTSTGASKSSGGQV